MGDREQFQRTVRNNGASDGRELEDSGGVRDVAVGPIVRGLAQVAFDAAFRLGYQNIFLEAFDGPMTDGPVVAQLQSAIVPFRGFGEDLMISCGFSRVSTFVLERWLSAECRAISG